MRNKDLSVKKLYKGHANILASKTSAEQVECQLKN